MSTFKYQVLRDGKITNEWTSDRAGPDYYDSSFGLPERWLDEWSVTPDQITSAISVSTDPNTMVEERNQDGSPVIDEATQLPKKRPLNTYLLPAEYKLMTTDITPDIDAETNRQLQVKTLKQRVKALSQQPDLTAAEMKEAILKLIRILAMNRNLD
jgi:hypothetical protein